MASANPDPLLRAASEIRRAANRLTRRLRTERSADALSTNKLAVLSHLYRNGPTTAGRIAAVEHQRPQSLTRVFAELERAGLIVRASSAEDRRQSVLELTMTGLRALADDMAERDAWLAAALGELSETERQVLRIAAGIMDRLAEADVAVVLEAEPDAESALGAHLEPRTQQDGAVTENGGGELH
jgi:DNA-binding MarR family transcriptional regulator